MSGPPAARVTPERRVAYEVLRRTFEQGAWADRAFRAAAERSGLEGSERARAQRLAYGAVQRRGTSDHLSEILADRPVEAIDPEVRAALRLGMFELMHSRSPGDHAIVGEAVELAKGAASRASRPPRRARAAAGLANAVLRRAARERADLRAGLEDGTAAGAAIMHSYPSWLAEMWWEELGPSTTRALMAAMNEPAETALRVNGLRPDAAQVERELRDAGEGLVRPGDGLLAPAGALVAEGPLGPVARARIDGGALVAQSRASQAAVSLLSPAAGDRVLDLCAAPGLKTTAIAARMKDRGEIVAVEVNPSRASELSDLCTRLGAGSIRVQVADAADADLGSGYDRVLVDPPCSDLGTLASRPDARWRKTPGAITELAALQASILRRGTEALAPGGTLVYSTCTISARENEAVVAAAVEDVPDLEVDPLGAQWPALASERDARFLQSRPDRDRTSGFFFARLRRRRS